MGGDNIGWLSGGLYNLIRWYVGGANSTNYIVDPDDFTDFFNGDLHAPSIIP